MNAGEARSDLKNLADQVRATVAADYPRLDALYKDLHTHPELSFEEVRTARKMAEALRTAGFETEERIGDLGVVGVLKNGVGPTLLIRTDMDALPVTEKTGLPYASKQEARGPGGQPVGVMHACGHDVHMTCWVGTATCLAKLRTTWQGTLIMIAQPAEERGQGAKKMLADGLYRRFPKPQAALALHCDSFLPHGTIGFTKGLALANVDTVDLRFFGRGGHGSAPHTTIDPIVIAARFILDVQTLISREIDPIDSAVVTVGSIHGGSKHNIIPAEVDLQITVRSFRKEVREHLLTGIQRIADAAAAAGRAPKPEFKVSATDFTPALYNHPELVDRVIPAFNVVLGSDNVLTRHPNLWGEDFARYADDGTKIFLFRLGTADPQTVRAAQSGGPPLPSLHSDQYAPVPEPSIKTGVLAMTCAALELLGPAKSTNGESAGP